MRDCDPRDRTSRVQTTAIVERMASSCCVIGIPVQDHLLEYRRLSRIHEHFFLGSNTFMGTISGSELERKRRYLDSSSSAKNEPIFNLEWIYGKIPVHYFSNDSRFFGFVCPHHVCGDFRLSLAIYSDSATVVAHAKCLKLSPSLGWIGFGKVTDSSKYRISSSAAVSNTRVPNSESD
jgi:hypothetical protein